LRFFGTLSLRITHETIFVIEQPRIKGTRIPVSLILGYLAVGNTAEQIIEQFLDITKEQIAACLDYARELSQFEVVAS
jgi:uncharacterized protein (DUF433 family)